MLTAVVFDARALDARGWPDAAAPAAPQTGL